MTNWGLLIPAVLLTAFHKLTAFRKDSYSLKDAFILTLGSIHFELAAVLPTTELKNHCFYFCMRFVAADSLLIRYCLKFQPQEGIIISGLLKVYIPMTTYHLFFLKLKKNPNSNRNKAILLYIYIHLCIFEVNHK